MKHTASVIDKGFFPVCLHLCLHLSPPSLSPPSLNMSSFNLSKYLHDNANKTTWNLGSEYDVTVCVFEMCVFEGRGRHVCVCDDDLSDGMCVMCVFDVYQITTSVTKVVLRLERH